MAGLTGMATGFALQYWASAIEYPMNVGSRPYATWPAFVIPSYELTILFSSLTAAIGMFASERPAPALPPGLQRRAVLDGELGQVLPGIESADPRFDHAATTRFLQEQGAKGVYDVAA